MYYMVEIVGADNVKFAFIAIAVLVYGVAKAWASMLVRRADQQWNDHGDDDDEEIKVRRVTDKVQADSTWLSMLPRGVVERQVRRSRASGRPPRPKKPPPN